MLQSLHLVSLNFHQEHEFLCMLSALHQHVHFRMLDIRSIYMTDQPSSTSQLDEFFASRNDQQRPPLKVVRFRSPEDALTGGLFLRPDSLFDLSKLQELEIMPEEIKSLCFLSHCGSLIRLMLDIRVFIWRGLKIDPFSLYNLNQLEYLEIDGLVFDHDLTEQASFIHTLLPVLPTSLKCLSLRFDVFMPHLMRNFSEHGKKMSVMDEALSSSARKAETETGSTANAMLRNLELCIIYRKKVSLELDVGTIESWFPRLKESGVVTTFERLE